MIASVIAILVNLAGNALLIYGLFGLPALGAAGAAIATVLSRFVELGVLMVYTSTHRKQHPFIEGAFTRFSIPLRSVKKYVAGRTVLRDQSDKQEYPAATGRS